QLIGPMPGGRKKGAAYKARPEGIDLPEVGREVEHAKLGGSLCQIVNHRPAAGDEVEDGEHADQRSADVDEGLDDIGPDHRREAALEGVNQSQNRGDGDGGD